MRRGLHWGSGWTFAETSLSGSLVEKWGSTSLSDSEKEEREDERLVRQSPKKKPPRRDLERGRIKDRDNSEVDPDERQDKKDRSNNYKDSNLSGRWGRLLYAGEERKNGDVWQTDNGMWSGKFDDKTQVFESEQSAKDYASGKSKKDPGDSKQKKKEKTVLESLIGEFRDLVSDDRRKRVEASKRLAESMTSQIEDFVSGPVELDYEAKGEVYKLTKELDEIILWEMVNEARDTVISREDAEDIGSSFTREQIVKMDKEFEKIFVREMSPHLTEINRKSRDRISKAKAEVKRKEDNRIISDLEGGEARQMEKHMFEVTKDSVEKYKSVEDKGERKSSLKELESQIKDFPEGSKRRMELEAEKRGLLVANILVDGPKAEGVGPSMSVLIQAAEKSGELDAFLELNLLGGENNPDNQQRFRDVLKKVGVRNLTEFMTENNPARKAIEVLNDRGFISRASPESKSELEELVIDSIVSGIIFTDAALNEEMPNSTVSKKNKSRIKVPQTENVWEKIRKMLESLRSK